MSKFKRISEVKEVYAKDGNIIKFLKDDKSTNDTEDILISYDFQAGSYTEKFLQNPAYGISYGKSIAQVIQNLGEFNAILEVGVGEATTLLNVINHLTNKEGLKIFGLDISWSRLKFAKSLLEAFKLANPILFVADLFNIPLADSSIDIVYTSHSIEPNGGKEEEALKELYRITKKHLVLFEPAYEYASDEGKARMKEHGYVTHLYQTALDLGYKVIEYRLFDHVINELNPTGLMIIEKNEVNETVPTFRCPNTSSLLEKYDETLYHAAEGLLSYPIVGGIPCLLESNAILTTHLKTDYPTFLKEKNLVIKAD